MWLIDTGLTDAAPIGSRHFFMVLSPFRRHARAALPILVFPRKIN
jgi:hypothetical protein